jgi:glutamate-ammonia-ligase adenylyltransferase
MGSLGSGVLNATSDLDLIAIYDPDGVESSEGPRPLDARSYYARLTQSLVTAITAPMGPGKLYEVDMRLRPSGRKGPVATALNSFRSYQAEEAWTWEHLALTRARPIAGSDTLGATVEAFRHDILTRPRDPEVILRDVAEMRTRLAGAKPGHGVWDAKLGPGRSQDIALLAQAGALLAGSPERKIPAQILAGRAQLGLSEEEARDLIEAHDLLWRIQAATRLMTDGAFDPVEVGAGGQSFLLRETGHEDMAELEEALTQRTARADAIITAHLPHVEEEGTADNG